jgi:pimeloyl-ACP methyl ester carboxylesterase
MGGYMAFEMMRLAPERVQRLALLDTSARGDVPARTANRKDFIALAEQGDFDAVKQRSLPILLHPDKLDDAELVATTLGMADEIGPQVFVQQMTAIMNRRDNVDSLSAIKVPTMVICGREDQGTPLEVSEEIAAGIPGARLCVVENCGHLSTLEQPEAVTALLRDWLLYD